MVPIYLHQFTPNSTFPFFIQYGTHDKEMFLHTHADFSELVLVLEGQATHIVDNESYPIKQGDVFVINQNTAHGFEHAVDFQICNIMFRLDEVLDSNVDVKKSSGFHALFVIEPYLAKGQGFQSRLTLSPQEFTELSDLISAMVYEYSNDYEGRNTIITSYFTQLVVKLSRKYIISEEQDKVTRITIAHSVSYMERHFQHPLSIKQLADISYLSERHFSRLFKETYHTTPGNYLNALRLQYARMLLKNPDLSITEIALTSGFNDSNFFARQFRKEYGCSPSNLRRGTHI